MQNSKIEWTDHTFNPWWGCQRVSPGCQHCYAETMAHRYGHAIWGPAKTTDRRMMSDNYWRQPLKWNTAAAKVGIRARVFCASMADVFEYHPQLDDPRRRLWDLIEETPDLDWLLLTKRPENITPAWGALENVWLGTSVENQEQADTRIPLLLRVPVRVRFLSCEPLLGPVDIDQACRYANGTRRPNWGLEITWIIAGGESGANARPMHPAWARSLRDQAHAAGVAFFFKQWGEHDAGGQRVGKHVSGRLLDGRTWDELPESAVLA